MYILRKERMKSMCYIYRPFNTGRSSVDFLYNFVTFEGLRGDFTRKENRPFSGNDLYYVYSITRPLKVTERVW